MAVRSRTSDKALYDLELPAKFPVVFLCKPFQINVHSVNIREKFFQDLKFRSTVSDQHIFHAPLTDESGRIPHILITDQRFIVSECDPDIAFRPALIRQICELFRRHHTPFCLLCPVHGYVMVLTERAGQIASVTACRQDAASREEITERFLLDGIKRQRRDLPVVITDDPSLFILSCPASAILPVP